MFDIIGKEIAAGAIATLFGLFKTIKFVQEGEQGIKLRFGRALKKKNGDPKVIQPGFVLLIPFIETLKRHHVRQQTLHLDDQKVMIAQDLIFKVSAIVIFRVVNIYKALFEIADLDNSLVNLSMGILRDVLTCKKYPELADMEKISDELLHKLQEKAGEWGVEFIQFKLTNCAPTAETAPLITAKTGVQLKIEALEEAAKKMDIKISEISPALAAALIGVPMVTAVTPDSSIGRKLPDPEPPKKSFTFHMKREERD